MDELAHFPSSDEISPRSRALVERTREAFEPGIFMRICASRSKPVVAGTLRRFGPAIEAVSRRGRRIVAKYLQLPEG